jgi:hypothetical protein
MDIHKGVISLSRDVTIFIIQGVIRYTMALQARVRVTEIGIILPTNDEGIEDYFIYCVICMILL